MNKIKFSNEDEERISEQGKQLTADYTIGFLTLSSNESRQDAKPAGSGTLVSINGFDGILTAAHVVNDLPEHGEVGILRFPANPETHQHFILSMEHTEVLKLGAPPYDEKSPDLAFIKLHNEDAGRLKVRNNFKNLSQFRDEALTEGFSMTSGFIGISGEIGEWVEEEQSISQSHWVKRFGGLFGVSNIVNEYEHEGWDFKQCHVDFSQETELPNSYGGMSGGGLWNIIIERRGKEINVADCKLCGVVFLESDVREETHRVVTCQGPLSVYGKLFQAVEERWPQ